MLCNAEHDHYFTIINLYSAGFVLQGHVKFFYIIEINSNAKP